VDQLKIYRIAQALGGWYAGNARDLPWRRTTDPYAIWISEIMLQQTQVKTVIPYYERWIGALPTIRDFAAARPDAVLKLWEGLGYYSRVRNAQAAARLIMAQHGGRFPSGFDDVLALPGIGRYTAGAICSIAFNQATPILDGNVIRVLTRVFGVGGEPRRKDVNKKLWGLATRLVSIREIEPAKLNQSLMELGALVCVARQPKCAECPVRQDCFARRTKRVGLFPAVARKGPATERRFVALVVREGDRFLVRRREAGAVNGGLWEFPNTEIPVKTNNPGSLAGPFDVTEGRAFFRVRHSITRYRILLEAFHATLPPEAKARGARGANKGFSQKETAQYGRRTAQRMLTKETKSEKDSAGKEQFFSLIAESVWKTVAQMRKLAFTSAHRKVLDAVAGEPRLTNRRFAGK
jgi:A/G-specific adenine glycosylase